MSHSSPSTSRFGFSTGALELGDFNKAVDWMIRHHISSVELSALRLDELSPIVESLDNLGSKLKCFRYISFHAPSEFPKQKERQVIKMLKRVNRFGWNIIVHPDIIYTPRLWSCFGNRLLIENMDQRKERGRTAKELNIIFAQLPKARLCLDVAHARQLDATLYSLSKIIDELFARIAEIHISELDSNYKHRLLSNSAVQDYQKLTKSFNKSIPVIIESSLNKESPALRMGELKMAERAMATPIR